MTAAYRPTIVAHRGLHHKYPENALAAFEAAWDAGIEWVECDVHVAADQEPVVIHDDTLDRTTTGRGPVKGQPAEFLRNLRLRDARGNVTDERLPTLKDLLRAMPPGAGLFVEIKPKLHRHHVFNIMAMMNGRRCEVQSFDQYNLESMSAWGHKPAWLIDSSEALARAPDGAWQKVFCDHTLLDWQAARRLRDAGKLVGAWTVNSPEDLCRIIKLRADVIISDEPLLAADMTGQ